MRVVITKEIEEWWGTQDLIDAMPDASVAEQDKALIELFMEDIPSLIDGSNWTIQR